MENNYDTVSTFDVRCQHHCPIDIILSYQYPTTTWRIIMLFQYNHTIAYSNWGDHCDVKITNSLLQCETI